VDVHPTTLSNLFYGGQESRHVLIEHARCENSLGVHVAFVDPEALDNDGVTVIQLMKDDKRRWSARSAPRPRTRGIGGPLTTPRVDQWAYRRGEYFARVWCPCLPDGHNEKLRPEKVGLLPVTFPDRKWGRSIDLPVVTI
jgi:hypothetical protein